MSVTVGQPTAGSDIGVRDLQVLSKDRGEHELDIERVSREVEILKRQIEAPHPNLVDIRDALKKMSREIAPFLADKDGDELHVQANIVHETVTDCWERLCADPLLKEQEKWVAAGFDRALLVSDPEAVRFAVSTRLIHTISMFKKTADMLEGEVLDIRNEDGRALFKVEGEWLPYSAFKDRIHYSDEECRFIGWNVIHPMGFIPRDWAEYGEIYPIAKVTPEAYRKLKAHAEQFWTAEQPEIDPGCEKGYILQVMTTGRDYLPNTWWAQNFKEHFPEHGSVRLITPEGFVYSFGTKMRLPDQEFLSHPSSYLGVGISNVPTPDYEEPRRSDDRLMTSLPVSKERCEKILDFVSRANRGICFNFARQNCVRFVATVLGIAGVEVNIRTSVHELLSGIVPRLSDIPDIGTTLSAAVSRIACVAGSLFDKISTVLGYLLPTPLKMLGACVGRVVTSIAQRIEAVFWNGIGLCLLGASKSIVPEGRLADQNVPEVETFRQLLHWSDIGTPDAIPLYYVSKLKAWMRRQTTSLLYLKPEHGFCCFDPDRADRRFPMLKRNMWEYV